MTDLVHRVVLTAGHFYVAYKLLSQTGYLSVDSITEFVMTSQSCQRRRRRRYVRLRIGTNSSDAMLLAQPFLNLVFSGRQPNTAALPTTEIAYVIQPL